MNKKYNSLFIYNNNDIIERLKTTPTPKITTTIYKTIGFQFLCTTLKKKAKRKLQQKTWPRKSSTRQNDFSIKYRNT